MRSADRRKFHIIYRTTCLITNRYYIGMHSTDNLNDGYIGSGKRLWQSIKKHGAENHRCEILEYLPSRAALREREAYIVSEQLCADPQCMNLALGGYGGWEHVNRLWTTEQRLVHNRKAWEKARAIWQQMMVVDPLCKIPLVQSGHRLAQWYADQIAKGYQPHHFEGCQHSAETRRKLSENAKAHPPIKGRQHSTETKAKIRETLKQKQIRPPSQTGRQHSEETKARIRASVLARNA